jgi:hypothetical protein
MERTERLLELCRSSGATRYVNAPGGRDLYDKQIFSNAGVELTFLQTRTVSYPQFSGAFVPGLSMVDVIMFNPKEVVLHLLGEFDLT